MNEDHAHVHHEESDINIRGVLQFAAGLAAVAVAIHVLMWAMFVVLDRREARADTADYPLAAGQQNALPPEPRLQVVPRQDLRDLYALEDERLNGYTWIDRQAGRVRLPIRQAMRLAVERGLPARSVPAQPAAAEPTPASGTQKPAGNQDAQR